MDLHLCLVATELFAWGRYGGFGSATRLLGSSLADRGVDVSCVVPLGVGQCARDELDGMRVLGFPLSRYPFTGGMYREARADVYHSQDPSYGTGLALGAVPRAVHVATCQNPKTSQDWKAVEGFYLLRRRVYNLLVEKRVRSWVGWLDAVYCQAKYIIQKARELYDLTTDPAFMPNPVSVPSGLPKKPDEPTVCFLGRFDAEKVPEAFFELAERFPDVRFVAGGAAHDPRRDRVLRRRYSHVRNLELPGFVSGGEKECLLTDAWILVNTSVSECLPVSFLEASAHGCAILSPHDPDGFASRSGCRVIDGDLDGGLKRLLEEDEWRAKGTAGYKYVSETHELGKVTDMHLAEYRKLLG